jgi:hypothetical protein
MVAQWQSKSVGVEHWDGDRGCRCQGRRTAPAMPEPYQSMG